MNLGWAIALLVVGVGLIFAELLIPSFGLITLLAICCFVGSVILAFQSGTATGVTFIVGAIVGIILALYYGVRLLRNSPLVLKDSIDSQGSDALAAKLAALVGSEGAASSALRPVGRVRIDGVLYDAHAVSSFIGANTPVTVERVQGNTLYVRVAETGPAKDDGESA